MEYYKEKKRQQRSKESIVEKERRLRQMRESASIKKSMENESPSQRESRLNIERQRSQLRCANESEAQREARLYDLRERELSKGLVSRVTIDDSSEQETVQIEPVTAKFNGKQGVTLQRTQLPLLPCWAGTIHKVQGLCLDAAVIDLGPKMFEDGMAHVALSRVRTLQGVALLELVKKKITSSTVANDEMDRLRNHRL
uniref:ATP-dependent DNA helicase n=1 Tax=Amphimedon queenslandica TaxID=400682 RepID=A0A1X7UK69_AMPQE